MAARPGKLLTISDLRIYPIKSCRGISLSSNKLTRQGLKNDRKWMFVDANNKFITIRQNSLMTLINTHIDFETDNLEITFPTTSTPDQENRKTIETITISVPLEPNETYLSDQCAKLDVEIWEYQTDAYTYTNPQITEPIKNFFKRTIGEQSDVKLVMKGPTPRIAKGNGSPEQLGRTETVNFPDVLPILVATEESLHELNSRLQEQEEGEQEQNDTTVAAAAGDNDSDDDNGIRKNKITIEHFRPNIVVKSANTKDPIIPWEEDEWRTLRFNPPSSSSLLSLSSEGTPASSSASISLLNTLTPSFLAMGSIDVDVSARCARCQVPNVNPDTGHKDPHQPWEVLMSYRRVDEGSKHKPCFGMLCCPRGEGEVSVGMTACVLEVMEPAGGKGRHKYIKGF